MKYQHFNIRTNKHGCKFSSENNRASPILFVHPLRPRALRFNCRETKQREIRHHAVALLVRSLHERGKESSSFEECIFPDVCNVWSALLSDSYDGARHWEIYRGNERYPIRMSLTKEKLSWLNGSRSKLYGSHMDRKLYSYLGRSFFACFFSKYLYWGFYKAVCKCLLARGIIEYNLTDAIKILIYELFMTEIRGSLRNLNGVVWSLVLLQSNGSWLLMENIFVWINCLWYAIFLVFLFSTLYKLPAC